VKEIYNHDNDIEKLNAFKAIGYRTILSSIKNNIPIDIERIKTDTRRYAKRQLT
jgi:tRNA A37 N6-isopentenylltransferase MiaA